MSDLQPANACNRLMKYADNKNLIVPAGASYSVEDELNHTETWSKENNLQLNQAKSQKSLQPDESDQGSEIQSRASNRWKA